MTTLLQLPAHILISVFDYLTCMEDYIAVRGTCKRFMLVLEHHHLITRDKYEEFQKCQREFYQRLAKFIPKDGEWKLDNYMLGFVCTEFRNTNRNLCQSFHQIIDGQLQRVTKRVTESERHRIQMKFICCGIYGYSEYDIIGYERVTRIYNDILHKLNTINFKVLNLFEIDIWQISVDELFDSIIRRSTRKLKLKKLVIRIASLTDLSHLHDNQDLFDDCYLYLQVCSNRLKHQTFRNTITGIARVFITGKGLGRKKAQRIFRDNRGQPAAICHKSKM